MRVSVNSFRGEAPRVTPRALPENAAQDATNARLLTGDLEAWRQFALEKTLANSPGPVKTIYKLKDVWLSWEADVNAARGAVAGDTTYRTFLTGPEVYDRPQFTNYAMATSGPEPYPADTRPLGVPGPTAAPTVVAGIDPNPTTFNVDVFDEGDQFAVNWTGAASQFAHGGATIVEQSAITGHPAPSYETLFDDNPGAPAYLYRNFGVEKCTVVRMSFDFYMSSGSGNYFQMNSGIMRTLAGAGVIVGLAQTIPGVGVFGIGSAQGWTVIGQASLATSSPLAVSLNTWYTCEIQLLTNSDGTQTATATLSLGSVQLAAVTTTGTFLNGDYGGFYSETSNNDGTDRYRTYYDNILVQGSGATGYVAANVATNYVYTYVNDLGQESAPSFASATVLRPDGIAITVTTPTTVPSGYDDYGVTTKRIYRAVSGAGGTSYQFVAETPLAQADYVDSIPDTELGEVLISALWALPPDDLHGLVALPNGVLAGFSKNQLCFSAQNYPHAWPVEYRLNVDTDIVAIGVIDTTVVIGTQNFIYLAIGTDPAAYSMTKLEVPQACVSKRSLAYLIGIGVVFASPDGLIAVAGNGNVRNLTSGVFTREQWQALAPETIVGAAHDDVYHFFYNTEPTPPPPGLGYEAEVALDEPLIWWKTNDAPDQGIGVDSGSLGLSLNINLTMANFGGAPLADGTGSLVFSVDGHNPATAFHDNAVNFTQTPGFTLEMLVKRDATGAVAGLLNHGLTNIEFGNWGLSLDATGHLVLTLANANSSGARVFFTSSTVMAVDTPYHVVARWEPDGTVNVFQSEIGVNLTLHLVASGTYTDVLWAAPSPIGVGCVAWSPGGDSSTFAYLGTMDEVAIWDRALSDERLQAHLTALTGTSGEDELLTEGGDILITE